LFRVGKGTFKMILQLAAIMQFLATGCYQLSVAKDHHINIGRSFFLILHLFIPLMDRLLCQDEISIHMTDRQMQTSREHLCG